MRLACLLTLAVACAHAEKSAQTPATPTDVVTAARAAIEAWRQAYEVKSVDALAKLYAHEPDAVIVLDGQVLTGWNTIYAMLEDKLAHAKEIHVRLKDVKVKSLAPTIASATATMTREMSDGVTTVTEAGALTLALRKDPDGWKIVIEHYSYRRP